MRTRTCRSTANAAGERGWALKPTSRGPSASRFIATSKASAWTSGPRAAADAAALVFGLLVWIAFASSRDSSPLLLSAGGLEVVSAAGFGRAIGPAARLAPIADKPKARAEFGEA